MTPTTEDLRQAMQEAGTVVGTIADSIYENAHPRRKLTEEETRLYITCRQCMQCMNEVYNIADLLVGAANRKRELSVFERLGLQHSTGAEDN